MPFSLASVISAPLALASSVLPAIPSVPLPANLQQRLVAFLLRRTLGQFIKGGLDDDRVQADVRAGRFVLHTVQVDEQAFNSLLAPTSSSSTDDDTDLPPPPFPLRFESGTVGCITANAAWPLTKLDLAVDDVELVFRIDPAPGPPLDSPHPSPPHPAPHRPASTNASPVDDEAALSMSIAHSFVSHELRPDEDAELRASLHLAPSASSASFDLPGAFGGARRDAPGQVGEDEAEMVETTVMARWVERVLARLEVRISRFRVRLVWDAQDGESGGMHEAEVRIDEVLCRGDAGEVAGTRSLEVTPPRVYLRSAPAPPGTPRPSARHEPELAGYASGSSEDESDDSADENDLLAMSQSIADLRTSCHSSASSARDMFHSAAGGFSTVDEGEEEDEDDPFQNPDGGTPDVFETPQSSPHRRDETPLPAEPMGDRDADDGWHLVVSLGPPPSASSSPEPRLAFFLTTALPPPSSSTSSSDKPPRRRPTTTLHAELSQPWTVALHPAHLPALGALVAQLSPRPGTSTSSAAQRAPVVKPGGPSLHVDLALRAVNVILLLPALDTSPDSTLRALWAAGPDPLSSTSTTLKAPHIRLRLDALAFRSSPSSPSAAPEITLQHVSLLEAHAHHSTWRTVPLLVDDPGLPRTLSQGASAAAVESVDWLRPEQALYGKDWRALPARKRRVYSATQQVVSTSAGEDEAREPEPAVRVRLGGRGEATEVRLAPVHAFADVGALSRLGPLIDAVADALPASSPVPSSPKPRPQPGRLDDSARPPSLTLYVPLLRLDIRIPAPRRHRLSTGDSLALRGGRLVLDLLDTTASLGGDSTHVRAGRLAGYFASAAPGTTTAGEFLRVAPLADEPEAVLPSLTLSSSDGDAPIIDLAIPLVHVTLDKPTWDGLQLVADDAGQFVEELRRAAEEGSEEDDDDERGGRDRLIGSRYFGAGAGRASETESAASVATVRGGGGEDRAGQGGKGASLRALVTDVIVDLHLDPLDPAPAPKRRVRLLASDLGAQVNVLTTGKDNLRALVSIMDVRVEDVSQQSGEIPPVVVLARTMPRNLTATSAPLVDLVFTSSGEKESSLKESKIQLALSNFTYYATADIVWLEELGAFAKSPAGAFEHVVPNELTRLRVRLSSASLHVSAPSRPSHVVLVIADARLRTDLMPDLPRTTLAVEVAGVKVGMVDSEADVVKEAGKVARESAWAHWKSMGFAPILDIQSASITARQGNGLVLPDLELLVDGSKIELALCADTMSSLQAFVADLSSAPAFQPKPTSSTTSTRRIPARARSRDLLASLDPAAFEHAPLVHDLPEILDDDVPANLDYLADALNQTSVRPSLRRNSLGSSTKNQGELLSEVDGETIRMFSPRGLHIIDDWLAESRADAADYSAPASKIRCRLTNADITIHLHEGYDWASTRKAIEEEAKAVRRRLEKIRQLLSTGQAPDASAEDASVLMFGSVQLGLPPGASELPPKELLAAIDEELAADSRSDVVSTAASSWQTLPAGGSSSRRAAPPAVVGKARKRLTRSKAFAIEVNLRGLGASFDAYPSSPASLAASISSGATEQLATRVQADVAEFEIIDNIKTSTWRKFLTELRPNDGGNVRPTGAPMARVEMSTVRPIGRVADAQEEILMKIKISPLRLYVDQDALDFLKAFGAFELPSAGKATAPASSSSPSQEPFYQRVEVLPVKLKLDYKPKRVDYNALRSGKTAELMNFFHFDGSEMTLRHLVVNGISGTTTLSSLVQDIWTPDVKAHQLADVISGIAPVRSVVNVGAGMANLVLLPIEQYRKDGRVVRGLHKGATAFARQTTLEAINVGARLATGTQVILEQAEHVLGARFAAPLALETVASSSSSSSAPSAAAEGEVLVGGGGDEALSDDDRREVRSRYASQPADLRQGMQSAYKSLGDNFKEAAQTILAVPMEVYERSGTEGPVRSVVRAVPVAVLKPMIGASGAVSKALLGLRNSLDPDAQAGELEDKYKPSGSTSTSGSGSRRG